jgi:hypothetical protein
MGLRSEPAPWDVACHSGDDLECLCLFSCSRRLNAFSAVIGILPLSCMGPALHVHHMHVHLCTPHVWFWSFTHRAWSARVSMHVHHMHVRVCTPLVAELSYTPCLVCTCAHTCASYAHAPMYALGSRARSHSVPSPHMCSCMCIICTQTYAIPWCPCTFTYHAWSVCAVRVCGMHQPAVTLTT